MRGGTVLENGFLCVGGVVFGLLVGVVLMLYGLGEIKTMVTRTVREWIDKRG